MTSTATQTPGAGLPLHDRPVVRVRGLCKRYGQHLALAPLDLDFAAGEVHVLFGENGAGKSTLISMLAGANVPTEGTIEVAGQAVALDGVAGARALGVRAVFQEFSLVPFLSVAQNIMLGEEPVGALGLLRHQAARREASALVASLGFDLNVDAQVSTLPRGKQQMVEICKAMRQAPRLLILDEPTASLSEHDTRALFALVGKLKAQGTAIIYITHRMHEIPAIGDRVSVLRDGRLVATVASSTPEHRLIELMTGRTLQKIYPALGTPGREIRLTLQDVSLAPETGTTQVTGASLELRAGEIVGVAGLVGCGKSELAQACFGLRRLQMGTVRLNGRALRLRHPADAIRHGIWYSPADRKVDGLALDLPAGRNISLSGLRWGSAVRGWLLRPSREGALLRDSARRVEFPAPRLHERVANFSGGNQQKVLLAKGLSQPIGVYLFDEPTVGVDVGARESIYRCLAELSAAGAAILIVSSDLAELMGMTHRMLVMNKGRIVREFARDAYDEHRILADFF